MQSFVWFWLKQWIRLRYSSVPSIRPDRLQKLLAMQQAGNWLVLDARTTAEFNVSCLPGAVLIGDGKEIPHSGPLGNASALSATASPAPWDQHPTLTALWPSLQITADCWALLAAPDGSRRKEQYLPKGEREPGTAYRKRLDAARPSGFFRDALRTYTGMLSRGSWISLPASLSSLLTDVDGRGTDLGVFLAAADLLASVTVPPLCWCSPLSTAGRARATARRPCAVAIGCCFPACSWYPEPTV